MPSRAARFSIAAALVLTGTLLRVWSFQWNDQLQGDVNLFALTARQFVQTGELSYPIKYEFSDRVDYCEPRSVASQHPPLFALAAGLLGRLLRTDETFPLLKLLSELGGVVLLLVLASRGLSADGAGGAGGLAALALVAVSPILVDFSGNGSPYVWSALILLLATRMVGRVARATVSQAAFAGALAAVAPQVHSSLIVVPASFVVAGLVQRRGIPLRAVAVFLVAGAVVAAPWVAWNLRHFGSPFYSYASFGLLLHLGLAREGIYGDVVTWRPVPPAWPGIASTISETAVQSSLELLEAVWRDAGPAGLSLAVVGGVAAWRADPGAAPYRLLPNLLYLAMVALLPFRDRFVVPLLPVFYVLPGFGFAAVWGSSRRVLAVASLTLALAWMIPSYFGPPPRRYYRDDTARREVYEGMRSLAQRFAVLSRVPTLAASSMLDGGIEAAYVHRQPLIRGNLYGPMQAKQRRDVLRKLRRDFDVRYVWADGVTLPSLRETFPRAKTVLANRYYAVLELPPVERRPEVGKGHARRQRSPTSERSPPCTRETETRFESRPSADLVRPAECLQRRRLIERTDHRRARRPDDERAGHPVPRRRRRRARVSG